VISPKPRLTVGELLVKHGACGEAIEWAAGKQPYEAWRTCHRSDWLLWIAAKVGVDRKLVVQAACDCAELALVHVPEGDIAEHNSLTEALLAARDEGGLVYERLAAEAAREAAGGK